MLLLLLFSWSLAFQCEWDCKQCNAQHCTAYYPCNNGSLLCPPLTDPMDPCQQLQCVSGICRAYTSTSCGPTSELVSTIPVDRGLLGLVVVMLMGLMLLVAVCIGAILTRR